MLNRYYEWPASRKIILAITGIVILFSVIFTILILSKKTDTANSQNPATKLEYCETNPKDLCILSFGRGGPESSVINFFVPNQDFPYFYLTIKKAGTESRYTCIHNSEIRTSVLCSGDPLSLKQTIEINILASEDDRVLATGTFFIEAFLVSTLDFQAPGTVSVEAQPSPTTQRTRTPALVGTPTPGTPTAESSATAYPDPSYP